MSEIIKFNFDGNTKKKISLMDLIKTKHICRIDSIVYTDGDGYEFHKPFVMLETGSQFIYYSWDYDEGLFVFHAAYEDKDDDHFDFDKADERLAKSVEAFKNYPHRIIERFQSV